MTTPDFTKMVPGFDFLQGLLKGAGSTLPSMSQWIAPTLDADEVDKRIGELRTVQFWLEQNARMLGATIQALEVQRMSLATLKAMNLPIGELRDSMRLDPQAFMPRAAPAAAAPEMPAAEAPRPAAAPRSRTAAPKKAKATAAPAAAAPGVVDPVQWWGALTRQFAELAAGAVKDNPMEAASQIAGAALQQAVQPVAAVAKAAAGQVAQAPRKAAKVARAVGAAARRSR